MVKHYYRCIKTSDYMRLHVPPYHKVDLFWYGRTTWSHGTLPVNLQGRVTASSSRDSPQEIHHTRQLLPLSYYFLNCLQNYPNHTNLFPGRHIFLACLPLIFLEFVAGSHFLTRPSVEGTLWGHRFRHIPPCHLFPFMVAFL
jgi:hypothetical protein